MKILNVLSSMDPIAGGGIMERVHQLSRNLIRKNHYCAILSTSHGWNQEFIDKIEELEAVSMPCISDRYMIPDLTRTRNWLSSNIHRFDILHLAGNWSPINVVAYKAAKKFKIPYVFSAMGWLAIDGRSRLLKHIFRILWTRPMLRDAQAVIAISPREVNDYIHFGVPKEKIFLIPNGIVTDELNYKNYKAFREKYGLDNRKIILFVGRLSPIKGADLLIEAYSVFAKDCPDYQLLIFGNDHGGFQAELETIIHALNVQYCVKIFPPIFGVEKSWAYHAAELFVIPSRYDTMTIVALEAAASGTPVLLTKQCDFDELQEAGGGLAVEASVEGLENGLRILLSKREELKEMGNRGKEYVLKTYNWTYVCKQFIEAFQKAVSPL